jgi:competence ComEA-like helix-hairpin-helix protein
VVTPDERRALIFLAVVAAAGAAIRVVRPAGPSGGPPAAVAPHLKAGDPARQAAASRRAQELALPLGPGEHVDLNRAGADELERLPRVGPTLARRIVAERRARGPFRSLGELGRVPGIGPRLIGALEGAVTLDGLLPPAASEQPGRGPRGAAAAASDGGAPSCSERVAVNRASAAELRCLPGIGSALAERIVAERTSHGNFRSVADLSRVAGLGAGRIARLAQRVTIP